MSVNFQAKPKRLPKNWLLVWNSENKCWNKNQHPRDTMCANLQTKRTTLTFLTQICPKGNLELEIHKTNVGIRISILEIPCVPIFRQNGQLWLFGPKFAQKWILGSEFQKSKSGFGISILEMSCTNFQTKKTTLNFWAQIFPKMDFGVGISKI